MLYPLCVKFEIFAFFFEPTLLVRTARRALVSRGDIRDLRGSRTASGELHFNDFVENRLELL